METQIAFACQFLSRPIGRVDPTDNHVNLGLAKKGNSELEQNVMP
jgi:hypothetical protein